MFAYTDTVNGSTVTLGSNTGNPGTAMEVSGAMVSQGSYAGAGFNFTNATGTHNAGVSYYDGTVGGLYTGIRFDIKANSIAATNCTGVQVVNVDLVDITNTNVTTDHKIAVPVTQTAWQPVTVFYNQCLSSTNTALMAVSLYQVQFQPSSNGTVGAAGYTYNYDFSVDNIEFTTAAAPPARTARGATIVDDMTNGSNQIEYGGSPGYLYDYMGSGTICPNGGAFFLGAPGYQAQDIPGIPSMAIHFSGNVTNYGGVGFWFANGNAYTNISAYTQLVFYAKSSLGNSFTITFNDSTTNGCYGSSVNTFSPLTIGTSWAAVTLTYNPSNVSYQFGTATGTSEANGCAGAASFTNHNFDPTQAANIQFEPPTAGHDLWLDNLHLQ